MAYGPSDLMGGLIGLVDKRWANVQDVQRLIVPLAIKDAARRIHFFREIKRLIRLIPTEIFSDEEQRQNLLNACQLALDLAIDQEEDEWQAQ
ncbi:TyeA family type III secretion system gatekeeper subunit [Pseudomonas sp. TH08]|uniref:TyeA family type III secretion system gatekeeper subunit n=1 Tax=unclassified Pseudomonas TaxID=196821 RepID=UPI001912EF71|nr:MULTISPECIES: TyeA family type III secretion system gatekeeper subunit [unclassified Pseudomonas]MBK5527054.1 TyeA family type III secretion system gatekeeper subunit [Pseudomonas sp. TH06]MBK5531687.1 TyeA family type III secretion system gatekeeper subunit [Pseudomonas sp. TH08]